MVECSSVARLQFTLDNILVNFASGIVVLAIDLAVTYLIVGRVVERSRKKELQPVERTATERLKTKLGVHFLTTFLINLVIEVTASVREKRAIPREVIQSYVSKLKMAQSDMEMLLGIYNHVLSPKIEQVTGLIISQIEHLQEDFEYLEQIHPRPRTTIHGAHIQDTILGIVQSAKEGLQILGADYEQIQALEEWMLRFPTGKFEEVERGEPIEVSGSHQIH